MALEDIRLLSNEDIIEEYVRAGAIFAEDLWGLIKKRPVSFQNLTEHLDKIEELEKEYGYRGYETINLSRFIDFAIENKPIERIVGERLENGKEPIFYAKKYRQQYLEKD